MVEVSLPNCIGRPCTMFDMLWIVSSRVWMRSSSDAQATSRPRPITRAAVRSTGRESMVDIAGPSAAIAAPPGIAQPEPHEMAPAFGLREIGELGAGVAGRAVVDVLDLARFEAQLDMQLRLIEHRLHGSERGRGLVVQPLAAQLVAGMDLAQRQPRLDRAVGAALDHRRRKGGALAGLVPDMAVVPERPVEPAHQLRMPLLQGVVDGGDAHHLADAALHRRMQAEQAEDRK